jgi:hypothetical protein
MDLDLEQMEGGSAGSCLGALVCKSIVVTVTVILTLMVLRWIVVLLTAPRFPLISAMLADSAPNFLVSEMALRRSQTAAAITGGTGGSSS